MEVVEFDCLNSFSNEGDCGLILGKMTGLEFSLCRDLVGDDMDDIFWAEVESDQVCWSDDQRLMNLFD